MSELPRSVALRYARSHDYRGRSPVDRLFDYLRVARDGFESRLRSVQSDDWTRSTPCEEWNVRQVVNHVVGQNFRYARLLEGGGLDEYTRVREDDFLGNDALANWARGNREFDIAYAQPGALEKVVEYHWGPSTGRQLLYWRVLEMTVHTWDLARGIGADDRLDEDLVVAMLNGMPTRINSSRTEKDAARGEISAGASPQEQLLIYTGRTVK
jgi:uncharacterized protein (TIGR03086 family)